MDWGIPEYSQYTTLATVMGLIGMLVFVPIFHKLKIADPLIVAVTIVSAMAVSFVKGFADKEWMFYLGKSLFSI